MMRVSMYWMLPLVGCLSAGCQSDQLTSVDPFGPNAPLSAAERPVAFDPGVPGPLNRERPLLGWDGSPVGSTPPGVVERTEEPLGHRLEEPLVNRLVLLDLYQQAVEERDGYLIQVEAGNSSLEQAELRYRDLQQRQLELQAAYDRLGQEKGDLEMLNLELTQTLTTAQIRRLEAERVWLEAAIDWQHLENLRRRAQEAMEAAR